MKRIVISIVVISSAFFTFDLFAADKKALFGTRIGQSIEQEIESSKDLGVHDIDIYVRGGHVTLSGSVETELVRNRIEQIAMNTRGAKGVTNNLMIKLINREPLKVMPHTPADFEIRQNLTRVLRELPDIDENSLKYDVKDAVISISGNRDTFQEVDRILALCLMVEGVKDINSNMTVKNRPY